MSNPKSWPYCTMSMKTTNMRQSETLKNGMPRNRNQLKKWQTIRVFQQDICWQVHQECFSQIPHHAFNCIRRSSGAISGLVYGDTSETFVPAICDRRFWCRSSTAGIISPWHSEMQRSQSIYRNKTTARITWVWNLAPSIYCYQSMKYSIWTVIMVWLIIISICYLW